MKKIIRFLPMIVAVLVMTYVLCYAGGQATSGKTADDIITSARSLLNQAEISGATPFCSDAEMITWIDEGQKDIVSKAQCLKSKATITLATSTMEYSWSGTSDYIKIDFYLYYNGKNYKRLFKSCESIGHTTKTGSPEYACEAGDKILIWPVPTSAYSGHTVYAYYVPMPTAVTATSSVIETPAIFDEALVWYVVSEATAKDKQWQLSQFYRDKYNQTLDRYRVDIIEKPKESIKEANPN